jgi:hypothetical protein
MSRSSHREDPSPHIGVLQETSLHADLKDWYAQPGDRLEVRLDGYVIDLVRGELLIEIQTSNFSSMKSKLNDLVKQHPVRLVHPIAQEKWIVRLDTDQKTRLRRRKSPKKGSPIHLFSELVRIPDLIIDPNFSLEVVLIQEEELWLNDGKGSWRRKGWSIYDRRLIRVLSTTSLATAESFRDLLPDSLPQPFSSRDLALALEQPRYLAQKMAYCLRKMGAINQVGKRGRSLLYEKVIS